MKKIFLFLTLTLGLIMTGITGAYAATYENLPAGKNYLDINNVSITDSGSNYSMISNITVKSNTDYTLTFPLAYYQDYFSVDDEAISMYIITNGTYEFDETLTNATYSTHLSVSGVNLSFTFNTGNATEIDTLHIVTADDSAYALANGGYFQLEEGTSSTSYEVYSPSTPAAVNLIPNIETYTTSYNGVTIESLGDNTFRLNGTSENNWLFFNLLSRIGAGVGTDLIDGEGTTIMINEYDEHSFMAYNVSGTMTGQTDVVLFGSNEESASVTLSNTIGEDFGTTVDASNPAMLALLFRGESTFNDFTFKIMYVGSYGYEDFESYIEPLDVIGPVMNGLTGVYFTSYNDAVSAAELLAMITATDDVDGDVTVTIDTDGYTGNETDLGDYDIIFAAEDSSENETYLTITVRVVDDIDPVITGPATVDLLDDTSEDINYVLGLISASDEDSTLSRTTITDEFTGNENTVGNYIVTVRYTDDSGNYSEHTVIVQVTEVPDENPPVLTFSGELLTVEQADAMTQEEIVAYIQNRE